jgi:ubiquinone/menaquinone biosynthesis C-methylase UbiE
MINSDFKQINNIRDVDWAAIWRTRMEKVTFSGRGKSFWDEWAKSMPEKQNHSVYVGEMLKRMKLKPTDTVLDVGAGMGALALPLARRVKQVTALDHSAYMLKNIAERAAREKIDNIKLLKMDWAGASLENGPDQHDIVLVSRSLPGGKDIKRSLQLIDQTARRLCYITWKADTRNPLEQELCCLLNIDYYPLPEFTLLYNVLYSIDIYANVELFTTSGESAYRNLEEAFTQIIRSYPVPDPSTRKIIMDFLADKLSYKEGYYSYSCKRPWALIWWEKS